jgi:hypothetical protein
LEATLKQPKVQTRAAKRAAEAPAAPTVADACRIYQTVLQSVP